jgi:peptidoglycan/LPS O-acetylase OafA/YrhL
MQHTKIFFPNLDGLRFFAFFVVFINHVTGSTGYLTNNQWFNFFRSHFLWNGDLGVSFFFVLSGFLITYLLLEEKKITGKINVFHFYIRRILRIWPLYFLIVALCLLVFPLFDDYIAYRFPIGVSIDDLNPWFYLTFTGNFDFIYNGVSNFLIGVLWSVSIEEQFYLLWPLVIAITPRKYLLPLFVSIITGSILFRFFYANGDIMIIKYHSLSCVSDLATGAVIAYLATKETFIERLRNIAKYKIIFIYLIILLFIPLRFYVWKLGEYYVFASSIVPVIFSFLFAFIILEQNYAGQSFYKMSNSKIFSSLGKFTYGMYCFHMIVLFLVLYILDYFGMNVIRMNKYGLIISAVLGLSFTILISKLSYRYFESNFLRLKGRFSRIVKD